MTVITLALGIVWSIGYATLVVGHLNILSMAFGVILKSKLLQLAPHPVELAPSRQVGR